MRVVLLSGNARPADAIGNQVAEKAAFFLERGADVRLLVEDARLLHPAVAPIARFVDVKSVDDEARDLIAAADLVIAEFGHAHSLLKLLPLCNRLHRRVLLDYHGITPLELWGSQNREPIAAAIAERGIAWCADALLCHSRFAESEIRDATSFPADRSFVIGHPVDTVRFSPGVPDCDWRQRLGITSGKLLLFVGRIAFSKRIDALIQALSILTDQSCHLALAGSHDDIYALEAERCREYAAQLGVADRVHWLGRVSEGELPDLYRSADVFVTASAHEGFCIPVIEALASGLPVVAARASALPETVGAGGLLFTPDDAADLAARLRRLLVDDPALAAVLRARGPCDAARHSRHRWREQFAALIEHVLDHAPRPWLPGLQAAPLASVQTVSTQQAEAVVPIRVTNAGSHAVLPDGPDALVIRASLVGTASNSIEAKRLLLSARLPGVLLPGQSGTVPLLLPLPGPPGDYRIEVTVETDDRESNSAVAAQGPSRAADNEPPTRACALNLQVLTGPDPYQIALADGARMAQLPVGYRDLAAGRLGRIKRWIRARLLGGFQRGYVDVLARQQSAMNRQLITAIAELGVLTERLAAAAGNQPNHHTGTEPSPGSGQGIEQITSQLSDLRDCIREMNTRLERLETARVREET